MCTTMSFIGWKFGIGSTEIEPSALMTSLQLVLQASPVMPLMFIEHEPQIAERHERRKLIDPSISAFAVSSASSTVVVLGNLDLDEVAVRHGVDGFVETEEIEFDFGHD